MPLELSKTLKDKIPGANITSTKRENTLVLLSGHMEDLKSKPKFEIVQFKEGSDYYASVTAPDTMEGKLALKRFDGAFPALQQPNLTHTGGGKRTHEFWSSSLDPDLNELRRATVVARGRLAKQRKRRKV